MLPRNWNYWLSYSIFVATMLAVLSLAVFRPGQVPTIFMEVFAWVFIGSQVILVFVCATMEDEDER